MVEPPVLPPIPPKIQHILTIFMNIDKKKSPSWGGVAHQLGWPPGGLLGLLGSSWGLLGPLGTSWGPLGASWGPPETLLRASWGPPGSVLGLFGRASWPPPLQADQSRPKPTQRCLGRFWSCGFSFRLGVFLGVPWGRLGGLLGRLGAYWGSLGDVLGAF